MVCPGARIDSHDAAFCTDIGNTRLKWAQYAEPRPGAALLAQGRNFWRTSTSSPRVPGRFGRPATSWAAPWQMRSNAAFRNRWNCGTPPAMGGGQRSGSRPAQWLRPPHAPGRRPVGGHDRCLPPHARQGEPRPMVVVMVGTAVTVEAIDAEGKFLGGLILPGHGIMLRALESGTVGHMCPQARCAVPHQHQRCADQRRHLCHCRCGRTHGATRAQALRRRTLVLHDRRCGLEDGAEHVGAVRAGRQPYL